MLKFYTVFIIWFGFGIGFTQTNSSDINLSTAQPSLVTTMDSILYSGGNFNDYLLNFTISDTANFGNVSIELSLVSNNQTLFRHTYSKSELQSSNIINNWIVDLNFGKFDNTRSYKVNLVVGNYAGVLSPNISKNY